MKKNKPNNVVKVIVHKSTKFIVNNKETIYCDVGIKPVIYWLNRYYGIDTFYSCEGNDSIKEKPYVVFFCINDWSLLEILDIGNGYFTCEVERWDTQRPFRYFLRFEDEKRLKEFIKKIKSKKYLLSSMIRDTK